jgi:hypothetical protein
MTHTDGTRLSDHPTIGERYLAIDYRTYPLLVQLSEPTRVAPPPRLLARMYHFVRRKVLSYVRYLRHLT